MAQTVAELLDAALALPEAERAELAELIAASLTAPVGSPHPANCPSPPPALRGSVVRFDRPTEPVAEGDWSTIQ